MGACFALGRQLTCLSGSQRTKLLSCVLYRHWGRHHHCRTREETWCVFHGVREHDERNRHGLSHLSSQENLGHAQYRLTRRYPLMESCQFVATDVDIERNTPCANKMNSGILVAESHLELLAEHLRSLCSVVLTVRARNTCQDRPEIGG